MKVAIVGAGPAGLMLALTLVAKHEAAARPIQITFFEREANHDQQPRANPDRSYTIDITGHGRKAIADVGPALLARFDKELIPFDGVQVYPLGLTAPFEEGGWTGSRGDICSALLHELNAMLTGVEGVEVTFAWQSEVSGIDAESGTIETSEGDFTFDLVAAGDGAGSLVRRNLEAQGGLTTTKSSINNYSRILHLDRGAPAENLKPSLLHVFSLQPWSVGGAILDSDAAHAADEVDAERLPKDFYVQMGYPSDAPLGTADRMGRLLSKIDFKLEGEQRSLADFTSDEEVEAFVRRDVHHTGRTVLTSSIVVGKCALIGDAATAFPPVGQGVNAALESAHLLGRLLTQASDRGETIQAAIDRYNKEWLPQAHACARIANTVRYDSRFNLYSTLVLGAIGQLTRMEMVPAQLAKDARYTYTEAWALANKRIRATVAAAGVILLAILWWVLA